MKIEKKDPDKTKTATPLQTANELLKSLSMEMDSKRIEIDSSHLKFEKMVEQKAILEKIINSYRGNPQKMSEAIAKYKAMYNIEDVDPEVAKILKNAPKSGVDFDRIELGSYCELEMSGSFPQGVTISGILAYSRIKYWFYADGDKVPSGGKISKFPRIEFFEREIKADIPFGKKYCVQFARGGSEESGSLEDAISKSSIFNMGTLSPFVIKTDSEKGANASGLLEEIEKKLREEIVD